MLLNNSNKRKINASFEFIIINVLQNSNDWSLNRNIEILIHMYVTFNNSD